MSAIVPIEISEPLGAGNFMQGSPRCLEHHHLCKSSSKEQSWTCKRCYISVTGERWACARCEEDFSICYTCAPVEYNSLLDSTEYRLSSTLLRFFTLVPASATMIAILIFLATLDVPDSALFQNTTTFLVWIGFLVSPHQRRSQLFTTSMWATFNREFHFKLKVFC